MMKQINLAHLPGIGKTLDLIQSDKMLITAGTKDHCNTMTASWGGIGVLWHKPMATIYVRPERYTYEFLEREDFFTLSFFNQAYKDAITFCGKNSGRDVNKFETLGLTVAECALGGVYLEQASLVLVCKKCYRAEIDVEKMQNIDPTPFYDGHHGSEHTMYFGEIVAAYTKES